MASEFYEQLGVDRNASSAKIRTAYGQHVTRLERRRRALVEQGGDTTQLDLLRAHIDEAWEVLSNPLRRRRYDAMLRWSDGERKASPTAESLWQEVSDGLVHPAAAVAAKLLRVTSRLSEIGLLPLAPSGAPDDPPTLVPHEDDLTTPRSARLTPADPRRSPAVALRVVDGSPGASDVLVMPEGRGTEPPSLERAVEARPGATPSAAPGRPAALAAPPPQAPTADQIAFTQVLRGLHL